MGRAWWALFCGHRSAPLLGPTRAANGATATLCFSITISGRRLAHARDHTPIPPPTMSPAAAFGLDAASNMSMFKFNRRLPPFRDEADDAIFAHDRHVLERVIESATSADACLCVAWCVFPAR